MDKPEARIFMIESFINVIACRANDLFRKLLSLISVRVSFLFTDVAKQFFFISAIRDRK